MSMSVGPYCDLDQDVDSANWTQGAVVSLVMDENERECEFSNHLIVLFYDGGLFLFIFVFLE